MSKYTKITAEHDDGSVTTFIAETQDETDELISYLVECKHRGSVSGLNVVLEMDVDA